MYELCRVNLEGDCIEFLEVLATFETWRDGLTACALMHRRDVEVRHAESKAWISHFRTHDGYHIFPLFSTGRPR